MSSNQGQTSQNPDHDIEQLENTIQQLRVEIDNINANIRCRHLAHITIRFLNILGAWCSLLLDTQLIAGATPYRLISWAPRRLKLLCRCIV